MICTFLSIHLANTLYLKACTHMLVQFLMLAHALTFVLF